ncbi:MAG: TlpA family protein disulfide reductase [Bacteroidetes bacterium]|nr:TlpA family protein disulfide reductase [Bacteroidota bacterium]
MKQLKYLFIVFFSIFITACSNSNNTKVNNHLLKDGFWLGSLNIQGYTVSFSFLIENDQIKTLYNSDEEIEMQKLSINGDSILAYFQNYPTFLKFKIENDTQINGYYLNPDYGDESKFNFAAFYVGNKTIAKANNSKESYDLSGTWETYFRPGTEKQYPAVGQFKMENGVIKGTFLKPSGDARFLEGSFKNNKLQLSSFDGSYATVYVAELRNDTLFGKYMSRNKGEIEWIATKNPNFKLEDSDKRTILVKDKFELNFKTIDGNDFHYPNPDFEGKTVIIQILGTWCPNCLDEGDFFKTLYEKYHDKGLEIFGVSYENPTEFNAQAERVRRLINAKKYPYPILVGGDLASNKIAKDFSMLDKVRAFPTSIFINKKGDVVRVETGFSGPGTGKMHEEYTKMITQYVESLLEL